MMISEDGMASGIALHAAVAMQYLDDSWRVHRRNVPRSWFTG